MKKIWMLMVLSFALALGFHAEESKAQQPDYAKYGNVAIAVVKADYPGVAVTEYTYVGRTKPNATDVTDSFRFKVTENGKPKVVIVKVTHNLANKKLLNLTVGEEKP